MRGVKFYKFIIEVNGEDVTMLKTLIKDNENSDNFINNLIYGGEDSMYLVLEMIIDGSINSKFIKIMLPMFAKSDSWNDFQTLLDFGTLEGELKISDYKSPRSKARKRPK